MGNAVCGFEHYEVVEEPVPSGLVNHAALAIVPIYPLRYVGGNLLDPKEAAETAVNRLGDLALNKQRENSQCHLLVDCTRGLCVRKTTLTNEQTWSAPFEVRQGLWVCGEYEGRTWAGKGQREKGEKSSTEIRVALDPQEFSLEPQPENLFHIGEI